MGAHVRGEVAHAGLLVASVLYWMCGRRVALIVRSSSHTKVGRGVDVALEAVFRGEAQEAGSREAGVCAHALRFWVDRSSTFKTKKQNEKAKREPKIDSKSPLRSTCFFRWDAATTSNAVSTPRTPTQGRIN